MIIDNNFLTDSQKDFLDNTVCDNSFPFYPQKYSVAKHIDQTKFLCHVVVSWENAKSEIRCDLWPKFEDILATFCKKHNIKLNEVYRCAVNYTYNNGVEKCAVHNDHLFSHKQLLICCNDVVDKNAKTVLLDDDEKTVLSEIEPKQYQGVCYDTKPHYMVYPKVGERIMIVY